MSIYSSNWNTPYYSLILTASEFQKCDLDVRTLRRTICNKIVLNLKKMPETAFWPSCMNRTSVLEWHKRVKEGRESVRDDERCGRSKEVRTPQLIGQIKNFMDKDRRVSIETISAQFDVSVGTVHTIIRKELKMQKIWAKFVPRVLILVTDYLTKMGINRVPQPPYCPDLAPSDFWLFPKLKGCRYETIEKMKEAVTKVIDTLTQENFHGPSRSYLNGGFRPEEITLKRTRVSCVYYQ